MSLFRYIALCVSLVLSILTLKAQELIQGSYESLIDTRVVSVEFDIAHATIGGQTLQDFIEFKTFEEGEGYSKEFDKDLREILGDFIDEYNETNAPITLTVSSSPTILLTIRVNHISRKGNEISCHYIFSDRASGVVLAAIAMSSKDGRIGSFTNLMCDAFERAGKDFGKYSKKMIKAELKKQKK